MTKGINYYGLNDNYIHLKFGDAKKMYNFTEEFREEYPDFSKEYSNYFMGIKSKFRGPFAIVEFVYRKKIPVHFYFNFTDTPAKNKKQIMAYLVDENSYVGDLTI